MNDIMKGVCLDAVYNDEFTDVRKQLKMGVFLVGCKQHDSR